MGEPAEQQLALEVPVTVDAIVLQAWRGLPFRDTRSCSACGRQRACAGRRRSSQVCVECFAEARRKPRRRRRAVVVEAPPPDAPGLPIE
jgi:hypothetical protein